MEMRAGILAATSKPSSQADGRCDAQRLLILGHQRWLAAAGFPGIFDTLVLMPEMFESGLQVVGMVAFRMIFIVAAVIVGIETVVVHSVRLFRSEMRASTARASKSMNLLTN